MAAPNNNNNNGYPPQPPAFFLSQHPQPSNIDPTLSATLYPSPHHPYASHPHHQPLSMLGHPPVTTPDSALDSPHPGGNNPGKRPVSIDDAAGPRKKSKQGSAEEDDSDHEMEEASDAPKEPKPKQTRGSRACTVCRRLKMKCVGAEQGPPCRRCETGGHDCVFEESNRGKRSTKKSEAMQKTVHKLEKTIGILVNSLGAGNVDPAALQNLAETLNRSSRSPPPAHHDATIIKSSASPSHLATSTVHLMSPHGSGKTPVDTITGPSLTRRSESASIVRPKPPGSSSLGSRSLGHPTSPKLDSLPDSTLNPLGLLADTSLAHRRERESHGAVVEEPEKMRQMLPTGQLEEEEDPSKVGLANDKYFKPGPMNILPMRRMYIERQIQPEMLTFVSREEVIELFKIFFDHMGLQCPFLDQTFHTPSLVCSRSPFLLTAICAVSSKFYTARPELHQRLNKIARKLAFTVPEQGFKSVEIVQAYLVLTLWGIGPVERYEQERTWILLGLAIRVATDLNMHRKIPYAEEDDALAPGMDAKQHNTEVRNRERTWLMCYILDRSVSSQTGKPHSIKEDSVIQGATRWSQHPQALPLDPPLAGHVNYQKIMSRALDFLYSGTNTPTGLQTDTDYLVVVKSVESQLNSWAEEMSFHPMDAQLSPREVEYRRLIVKFYYQYANLLVNSFGLQNAIERSPIDLPHFFARCYGSATTFINVVKLIAPLGHFRYAPDSHFVFLSYAVLTLLKLIRPDFKQFIGDENKVLDVVNEMADLLEGVAINAWHTPALYSTFLRALLSNKAAASQAASPRSRPGKADGPEAITMDPNQLQIQDLGASLTNPSAQFAQQSLQDAQLQPTPLVFNAWNHFNGETGQAQVQDMSTFPPTFAPPADPNDLSMFSMDNILGNGFWDNVLVPGYSNSAFEGLSGGFAYGPGGQGFITPKLGTPVNSGNNTPARQSLAFGHHGHPQSSLHSAFDAA